MAESSGTGKWIVIVILAVVAAIALFMLFGQGAAPDNNKVPDKVDVKIEAPKAPEAAPSN